MENKGTIGIQEGCGRFKIENYKNVLYNAPVVPSDPSEAMRFDNKTDEQIVYESGYETVRPIQDLISNDETSRHALRKKKNGKIPRRLNKWIIYRRDKSFLPKFKGLKSYIVTEEIRQMWSKEPNNPVKEYYAALSRLAEKYHKQKFGEEYKYQPGPCKNKQNKDRKVRKVIKERKKLKTQATPVTPLSPAVQQLQQYPTPETSNSSPVSGFEELSPVEQNFPLLPEISLSEALLQQQGYLQTPATTMSNSPETSFSEESTLNFSDLMIPPLPEYEHQLNNSSSEFVESSQTQENNLYAHCNSAPINLLKATLLWKNFSEEDLDDVNVTSTYNIDWPLFGQPEDLDNTTDISTHYNLDLPLFDQTGSFEEGLDNVDIDNNLGLSLFDQLGSSGYLDNTDSTNYNNNLCSLDFNQMYNNIPEQQQQYHDDSLLHQADFFEGTYDNDDVQQYVYDQFEYYDVRKPSL